ncbi:MAG TPA: TfoX/Sxy family protein [Acidimicrobiia bacterium]|jgi:TfoX/Sxy family transcriptional regulator of competence genes|nr:TfoX/Sxy family protein [Acidimicrobiia bacterium]
MAYDEALAHRVREKLSDNPEISERKMFGGIGFMLSGNMAVGVSKDELMVRIDPDDHDEALAQPGVRISEMGGRPMKGWILVAPEVTEEDSGLRRWIQAGLDFAGSLPPK